MNNINNQLIYPIIASIKNEGHILFAYVKRRVTNITDFVKKHPKTSVLIFVGIAAEIYLSARLIFFFIPQFFSYKKCLGSFSIFIIHDYLNNTFVKNKKSGEMSSGYWFLYKLGISTLIDFESRLEIIELNIKSEEEDLANFNSKKDLTDTELEAKKNSEEFLKSLLKEKQALLEEKLQKEQDQRPTLLVLRAKDDHNRGLQGAGVTINGDNASGVDQLTKEYQIILLDDLKNVEEIKEKVQKIAKKVKWLWINAHGSPTTMHLEGTNKITIENVAEVVESLKDILEPDADILLNSCSTAGKNVSGENIATKLSELLPGRTVWAAKDILYYTNINIESDLSIKVNLQSAKTRLSYLIEKVSNILHLRPFHPIKNEDLTVRLKNGVVFP